MRFGYVTPNSWGLDTPQQVIDLAVQADGLGADSLWVSHHVLHQGFVADRLGSRPYYDPLVMLAAFATATSTARLGTSVLLAPYLHPMPTAKTFATIDQLSR
ncbi:MAG: LLM class flavin-dependent oxidoreductase, partial [Acidimicrobiia bacterium]